jgi:two-component sensor histidine kinase
MMLWRLIMYSVLETTVPEVQAGPSAETYLVSDVLLLPVLLLFCRLALAVRVSRARLWWLIPLHFVLGLVFAALREPFFRVATHWIDHGPSLSAWWAEVLAQPRVMLNWWAGFAIQYVIAYTTAIGLMGGVLLYRHWRATEQRRLDLETLSVRSRLQALRMQLNPHFLFNALHLVTGLIDANPGSAKDVVVRLGSFLRRVLSEPETEQIRLGEELEFVEDYLAIQRARFGERVSCSMAIAGSAREALVPPLILQPLIENAVKHGMGSEEASVRVELSAQADAEWLDIVIANELPSGASHPHNGLGIGLKNLRERLSALYGDTGYFEDALLPSGRYVARLRVPYETTLAA